MYSILGVVVGGFSGAFLAYIAYKQQLPKWKKQGFSRAKTPEEKLIVKNYYKELHTVKMLFPWKIPALAVLGLLIIRISFYYISEQFTLVWTISFLIVSLGGFVLSAFLADESIRKSANKE